MLFAPVALLLAGLSLVLAALPLHASSAESPGELTTIAARWSGRARCFEFGRSPENRPLLAIAVSGQAWTRYDSTKPTAGRLPFKYETRRRQRQPSRGDR